MTTTAAVGVLTNDDRVCFGRKIVYDAISGGFSKINVHTRGGYKFPFICMAAGKRALVSGLHTPINDRVAHKLTARII